MAIIGSTIDAAGASIARPPSGSHNLGQDETEHISYVLGP